MYIIFIDIEGNYLKTNAGPIHIMLTNITKENIGQISVDLRIAKIFTLGKTGIVDLDAKTLPPHTEAKLPYILKPGEYLLAQTIEEIHLGERKYGCLLQPRSRAFRIGLAIETSISGPTYEGPVTFGIANQSRNPVRITKGLSIVQLAFFDIKGEIVPIPSTFHGGKVL